MRCGREGETRPRTNGTSSTPVAPLRASAFRFAPSALPRYPLSMPDIPTEFPNLRLFDHPLIQHKLTAIRDEKTGYRAFRALLAQIAGLMVFEVTRSFPTEAVEVR